MQKRNNNTKNAKSSSNKRNKSERRIELNKTEIFNKYFSFSQEDINNYLKMSVKKSNLKFIFHIFLTCIIGALIVIPFVFNRLLWFMVEWEQECRDRYDDLWNK